jgi:peptidoglycan/LPS O-acetylase OafA/YrhL
VELIAVLAIASTSYFLIEKPLLGLRRKFGSHDRVIADPPAPDRNASLMPAPTNSLN